jgi:hypothetical protein
MPLALPSSTDALMTATLPSPLSASRSPKVSFGPDVRRLENACCDQLLPLRTNT